MKHLIFHKDTETILRDVDKELMEFKSNDEVWNYLHNILKYSPEFIERHFCIVKRLKILQPETMDFVIN